MNLRQMEVFHAIMRAGSVTCAARLLNVTQPAVSTVLRHCETQLRVKLFDRTGGRLHPRRCCTDQGCGRSNPSPVRGQAMRTEIGRPSSSIRLRA